MSPKRLLITGGSGFLGRTLLRRAGSYQEVAAAHRHPDRCGDVETISLDLTDAAATERRIEELAPDAILHTAAVNPGGPEEIMTAVNVEGSEAVARAAQRLGCRLVHVSSDVVHDGRKAPYGDTAEPTPLWVYGQTKAAGEEAVLHRHPEAVVVRTSLIYGLAEVDRVTAGFVDRLKKGQPLTLFTDQIRQPIWVETLADALLELVELEVSGLLNVAGRQALTRAEIAQRLLGYWRAPAGEIHLKPSTDLGLNRPTDLRLDVSRAAALLTMPLLGLDEVLAQHGFPPEEAGSSPQPD